VALSVLGCGPAAPGTNAPTPSTTASPAASSTVAPSSSGSPAPAVTKRFEIEPDVVVDTTLLGTEDLYVNPGAVLEVDGVLHMFPNSFSKWPGRMRVAHLTSTDGVDWALDPEADLLDTEVDGTFPMADPGIDVSTGYLAEDGTWVLIFETVSLEPWTIWRATAPSPQGPWTIDDKPILGPGPAGAFDAGGVQWPSVTRVGNRWAMYYAGAAQPTARTAAIGVAFSDDGVSWTRSEEPVLLPSEPWELNGVDRPRVVSTSDGLVMVYAGLDLPTRGLATSVDGLAWTKVPGPAIEQADFPILGGAWDAALLHRDGELEYFLEIGQGSTKVYRATLAWP
jgi:hypothetical protein